MKSNLAVGILSALVYLQVVLCIAGAATVLMRDHTEPRTSPQSLAGGTEGPVVTTAAVRL